MDGIVRLVIVREGINCTTKPCQWCFEVEEEGAAGIPWRLHNYGSEGHANDEVEARRAIDSAKAALLDRLVQLRAGFTIVKRIPVDAAE